MKYNGKKARYNRKFTQVAAYTPAKDAEVSVDLAVVLAEQPICGDAGSTIAHQAESVPESVETEQPASSVDGAIEQPEVQEPVVTTTHTVDTVQPVVVLDPVTAPDASVAPAVKPAAKRSRKKAVNPA